MGISKIMVVGAGLMGSGIAQVSAQSGIHVYLNDISQEALNNAFQNIAWSVGKLIDKGQLKEEKAIILSRIKLINNITDEVSDVDIAIESITEEMDDKKRIFSKIDQVLNPAGLIASNTSAIPISELAAATNRPGNVLGIHFFSPVPMMQAVEIIKGIQTTESSAQTGKNYVCAIGKEPIMVNSDVAGFVINRINFPSTIEAIRLVEEGVATCEDIDKGLKLGSGRKMGIFETSDMVGLDVTHSAMMAIYKETGDHRFYPPRLLRRKVKAGLLGRKTGEGWYKYDTDGMIKK